jgi:hypothetical protein
VRTQSLSETHFPIRCLNGPAVFTPGRDYFGVDPAELPPNSVRIDGGIDGNPQGHVSVTAAPEQIKMAIKERDKFPP